MPTYVTKQEFAVYLSSLEESIDNLNKQFVIFRDNLSNESPEAQLTAFKSIFDEQIAQINIQLQQLRGSKSIDIDIDKQLIAISSSFNEQIQSLLAQLAVLRAELDKFYADYKGTTGFIAYQAIIDEQIGVITKQIALLMQRKPDIDIDNQISSITAMFDDKIEAINKQLLVLRGSIEDVKTAEIDGMKLMIEESLRNSSVQILKLQNDVNHLKDLEIEIPESVLTQIENLQNIYSQILVEIKRIEEIVPTRTDKILIDVVSPGDVWAGTKHALGFEEDTVLKWNILEEGIVTRTSGVGTFYELQIAQKRNNEFDWVVASYAKVLSGRIRVDIEYGKGLAGSS